VRLDGRSQGRHQYHLTTGSFLLLFASWQAALDVTVLSNVTPMFGIGCRANGDETHLTLAATRMIVVTSKDDKVQYIVRSLLVCQVRQKYYSYS
jgi:hypothetical protein